MLTQTEPPTQAYGPETAVASAGATADASFRKHIEDPRFNQADRTIIDQPNSSAIVGEDRDDEHSDENSESHAMK